MADLLRAIEELKAMPPVVVRFECNMNAYGALRDLLANPTALDSLACFGIPIDVSEDIPLDGRRVKAVYSDGRTERFSL